MLPASLSALVVLAGFFDTSVGHPLTGQRPTIGQRDGEEPCKQLGDAVADWLKKNPVVHKNITEIELGILPAIPPVPVKPSLAFNCLKSIPLDRDRALGHVAFLRPFWEWQSTLDYNKNPPRGYLSEGVDLIRGTKEIEAKLRINSTGYANHFEFLVDLQLLQHRVRDAHFGSPAMLLDLFTAQFGRKFVSISQDGRTLPEIFLHDDVKHNQDGYEPSPVSKIDGIPALEFLQDVSLRSWGTHDPDARFNTLFPSVSKTTSIYSAAPELFTHGISDPTTVVFQNGTTVTFDNVAFVLANLTNISSGADLYRDFGLGDGKALPPIPLRVHKMSQNRYAANFSQGGFPKPVASTLGGDTAWFHPDTPGLQDTAVLAISSFDQSIDINNLANMESFGEIYKLLPESIAKAKAAGRTKLLIDLQDNGGGFLHRLLAVISSLFPDISDTIFPLQSQTRAHPQLTWLQNAPRTGSGSNTYPLAWIFSVYRQVNGTPFPDTRTWLGPVPTPLGNFTVSASFDPDLFLDRVFGPPRNTTTNTTHHPAPPFAPENITILTDGECASSCALLVEVLTRVYKVRTVALGGRPLYKPMQAVGQTKGAPAADFGRFPSIDRSTAPPGVEVVSRTPPPLRLRGTAATVNRSDMWGASIRFNQGNTAPLGDGEDAVPLQFRYEAAHCRVFWTWEMARDIKAVWEKVAGVAWGEGRCVEGSTTGEGGGWGGRRGGMRWGWRMLRG
ncbi:hypothetical protein B0T16DRAFT_459883 [Cercophora newfieldiana]|uniref:Tail specific protease domain-containing protein n=1 Tax=Cercophora newfieldiana TaxID=92897 RepID=A0AA40CLV9_9PEZI|nr:hypothetical protein B0T16DRAFT_459883 [Cercophora newfieldiana]